MPRRKREENGAGDSASKKSKSNSCSIAGHEVRWEWEADDGWQVYKADFQEQISKGYDNGKSEVVLDMGKGVKMRIVFDRNVQKNKLTGWERRIRACLKNDDDGEFYAWEWEDEHGKWSAYDAATCVKLTEAVAAGDTSPVPLRACRRNYTIHTDTLEQVNDDTDVKRKIRHHKSECEPLKEEIKIKTEPEEMEEEEADVKPTKRVSARAKSARAVVKEEPGETSAKSGAKGAGAKSGAKAKSGSKGKSGASAGESPEKVKTVVMKGKAPVDPDCPKADSMHVFSEGNTVWDCMTNQTNLQNNNNKYYLMQILEDDKKKAYSVWFRWGRVGKSGQNSLISCGPDLEEAKDVFCKKFRDKTKNDWALRNKFEKVAGKYDWVKIDYNADQAVEDEDTPDGPKKEDVKTPDSELDERIQNLIDLICDVKSMEDAVTEMKYDAKRAPLGKLTKEQIKAGNAALKKIESCIDNNSFGAALIQACDEFYTRIPHSFGMKRPPIIRTKEEVKQKIALLEALEDIEVAMKIIKRRTSNENPIDTHYKALKCDLEPLDHTNADFKLVNRYLQETHAPTHNQYTMQILDVFDVSRGDENKNFTDYGNNMLLWHGSRLTNWMGILSQGLRIAPPEAPVTGYMFGKGVYFADVSSKSANYCYATKSKSTGLLLLCEVSMGKPVDLLAADINAASLPDFKTTHSVCGQGALAPPVAKKHVLTNGTVVPLGKVEKTGVKNPNGYTLNYNEFIVYNVNQIRMKYLVKLQFNFKY